MRPELLEPRTGPEEVLTPGAEESATPPLPPELKEIADALAAGADPSDEAMVRKIRELPREVGVMLVSVGALGFVLPGLMGTPAIIAGGLVLWPKAFGRVESWFERKYPKAHHRSMRQIGRFLADLERRYPGSSEPNRDEEAHS
ncbi:MAG: hypothetical protein U0835_18535 [Isosphaeraceae bacterium]